ncbi:hypothetical protein ACFL9T_09925 [Thermodesulfobacteriota bacterium]
MIKALIALHITTDAVTLAEISRGNGEKIIKKIRRYKNADENSNQNLMVTDVIKEFIHRESPKTLQTLLVLSSQDLDYRDFSFPFGSSKKVDRAIHFEIASEYSPNDFIVDHIKSYTSESGNNTYLAAMTRKEMLADRIKSVNEAGLQIIGITTDTSILGHFLQDGDESLVMEMGEQQTLFVLYIRGVPVLIRDIPIGLRDIRETIEGNNPPNINVLAGEIKRTVHSFNSKSGLDLKRIYLAGDILIQPEIVQNLNKALGLEFIDHTPEGLGLEFEEESVNRSIHASLLGAAEWKKNDRSFDFLKDEFLESDPDALGRRLLRWGIISLASLLLAVLLTAWLQVSALEQRKDFLHNHIRKTFSDAFPDVARIEDEVKQADNLLKMKKRGAGGSTSSYETSLLDVLELISRTIKEEINFQIMNLFWERGRLEINARTDSLNKASVIEKLLADLEPFSSVRISNVKRRKEGQNFEFTITVRLAK